MTQPGFPLRIRELDSIEQAIEAAAVLRAVWGGDRDAMPAALMRALGHAGNYVVGLFDEHGQQQRMLAASVAFFAPPATRTLHSHITGVLPQLQGRGLGRVLKQHQRDWALERGVEQITWTFDPLVARNAHFNLGVLGTTVTEYLVNQYGPMNDGVNQGDESDRLMVSWALTRRPEPAPTDGDVVETVEVPGDIEAIRRYSSTDAAAWRHRVREAFARLEADGLRVGGFDGRGYLFVRR